MGMAASLVMWPGLFEQTFIVPPSQGGSIGNLALIGPVVSEMFENVGNTHSHILTSITPPAKNCERDPPPPIKFYSFQTLSENEHKYNCFVLNGSKHAYQSLACETAI